MTLRNALITTALGWALGIGTAALTQNLRESHERRELASMLLVEVQDNYKRLTSFAQANEPDRSDPPPKGKVHVQFVTAAEVQTTRFEATLPRQGLLPIDVIGDLHKYYADIRIVMEEEKNFSQQTRLFAVSAEAREIAGRLIPRLQAMADSTLWPGF